MRHAGKRFGQRELKSQKLTTTSIICPLTDLRSTFFPIIILLCLSIPIKGFSDKTFRIISYNVENLFDTKHDTLKQDSAFIDGGDYHWTYSRYSKKIDNISRVIANISEWNTPAVVGLCEVENEHCVKDLVFGSLANYHLRYIHYESPDLRGIDCVLLYDPKQFELLESKPISVRLDSTERPTRDLLYAKGKLHCSYNQTDTLNIIMCHLPSQRGGSSNKGRREIAFSTIQSVVDSILNTEPKAKILVMGDMNCEPENRLHGMTNLMLKKQRSDSINYNSDYKIEGTYKYMAQWSYLDQFFCSNTLINKCEIMIYSADWLVCEDERFGNSKPFRTYSGRKYSGGFSDHLPIYIDIHL